MLFVESLIILILKNRDAVLDQQKPKLLKPPNFQLKALTTSNFENTSYIEGIRNELKDDSFTETMQKKILILMEILS